MNYNTELYHHGILGQKWGVRRYQNPDGSLTAEGKKRYGTVETLNAHQEFKSANKQYNKSFNSYYKAGRKVSSMVTKKGRADFDLKTKKMMEDRDKRNESSIRYHELKKEHKNDYKKAREEAYKKVKSSTTTYDHLVFDKSTMKKAAKYMADNDMKMSEALNKAAVNTGVKKTAVKVAKYLAVIGGIYAGQALAESMTGQAVKEGFKDAVDSDLFKNAWRAGMNR